MEFVETTLSDSHDQRFGVYEKMAEELSKDERFIGCKNKQDMLWLAMNLFGSEMPKTILSLVINRAISLVQ